jgi:hypothetical protein
LPAVSNDVPQEIIEMQHTVAQPPLQKPIAIEVAGEPLGIVIPSAAGFRFLAVRLPVFALDGMIFETVEAAQLAAAGAVEKATEQ